LHARQRAAINRRLFRCGNGAGAAARLSRTGFASPGSIEVDSRIVQSLAIRTAVVEQGSFARVVDTVGLVGVDEHRIEVIQVRQSGWVERLNVRAAGDSVHLGQPLAGIYSPELLASQQELLIARSSQDPALISAARQRLTLFGLSPLQLARIEQTGQPEPRIDYYAPFDGYVMDLGVRQGGAVEPIMIGNGTGSEVMRRIAAPMIGGMITAPLLSMLVLPAAYLLWHRRRLKMCA
jgi:hypothetical protein